KPGIDPITAWTEGGTHRINVHQRGSGDASGDFVPVDLEQFVEVKGCGYFFSPSLKGIADMTSPSNGTHKELSAETVGKLIVENMPYGSSVITGSLERGATRKLAETRNSHELEVQSFGALKLYNAVNPLRVKVIPPDQVPYMDSENPDGVVVPVDPNVYS